jgi:cysteine desulfurase
MKLPIYMDHHATTPVDPRVFEAMAPYFTEVFGNAASRNHVFGWAAEAAVDEARQRLAEAMNASPKEIVFTSGATESNNLALFGAARMYREKGTHLVTCETEHNAVLDPCKALEAEGFRVTRLAPEKDGSIPHERLRQAITGETILVSLMLANNEIGTLHALREIGAICKEKGVLFHTDAVQGFGKVSFDVEGMGVDLASVTAHKLYGPKGVGALYVRSRGPRVRLVPILHGGGHERGLRSGTLNVPGIVGFARAVEIVMQEREAEARRLRLLRESLFEAVVERLDGVLLNGAALPGIDAEGALSSDEPERRLPGNLNLSFSGVEGEALLIGMRDVAVSSGSACTSARMEPSHVLRAIGIEPELAHASIRFGLGRFNTAEEVDYTVQRVVETVERLREHSPLTSSGGRSGPRSSSARG